jgi:hypothetical protein
LESDSDVDYEYTVDVVASEAFKNLINTYGVDIGYDGGKHRFFLNKLIDMKRLKAKGIIRSYRITKWVKTRSVVEEEG